MPSHLPNTSSRSATSPLLMNSLLPLTMMLSPSARKRVFMPVASDPASASVMASAPRAPAAMRGRKRCFCASVPMSISGFMPWKVVA